MINQNITFIESLSPEITFSIFTYFCGNIFSLRIYDSYIHKILDLYAYNQKIVNISFFH